MRMKYYWKNEPIKMDDYLAILWTNNKAGNGQNGPMRMQD